MDQVGWGLVGFGGEQIFCYQTPPGRFEIFKKRLCRVNAGSGQMVFVYFENPTCHRDFPGTNFCFFENIPIRTPETIEQNTFCEIA